MASKFSMIDLLNGQSKAEVSPTVAGFSIQSIPIGKIIPSAENKYGIRDIEELAASIEEIGLLHNIVVKFADGAGNYELISGERRYHACKSLYDGGNAVYAYIPCKVETAESTELQELKLIHANATARVLTDYEKTMQAARLKELLQNMKASGHKFKGRMRDIVAEILKVSSAQMGRMESIGKHLSPEGKEEFEAGNIGISAAYDISRMERGEQEAALKRYLETGKIEAIKSQAPAPPIEVVQNMERDTPSHAEAYLSDVDGQEYEAAGNIALIAAVNTETGELSGAISTATEAAGMDYVLLVQAVVAECFVRIGSDQESLSALKENLTGLFDGEIEV